MQAPRPHPFAVRVRSYGKKSRDLTTTARKTKEITSARTTDLPSVHRQFGLRVESFQSRRDGKQILMSCPRNQRRRMYQAQAIAASRWNDDSYSRAGRRAGSSMREKHRSQVWKRFQVFLLKTNAPKHRAQQTLPTANSKMTNASFIFGTLGHSWELVSQSHEGCDTDSLGNHWTSVAPERFVRQKTRCLL